MCLYDVIQMIFVTVAFLKMCQWMNVKYVPLKLQNLSKKALKREKSAQVCADI
jgi:hypothetical protein